MGKSCEFKSCEIFGGIFMKKVISIITILLLVSVLLCGAESVTQGLQKTTLFNSVWMNCNRMNGVFNNNGTWFYDYIAGDWGLEWPQGSGLSPIFAAGQYVGAMVEGEPRVAGVQHSASEFQAGEILSAGVDPPVASDPNAAYYKWYELRPGGVGDWTNWPVDQGAPLDASGNPLLIGDQTLFSVWNDLADHTEYNTKKLGVEVRQLAFAFNRADAMGDMIFVKWQLINKSAYDWEDTYFIIWSDPDLGDAGDDLVGCDTTLGLGYCYNAVDNDQNYGGAPPAVGIDFFQGPIIDSPGSTVALPDGTVLQDKEMLNMTSFIFYNNDDSPQGNPQSGGDVWNYMRGYWRDGNPIVDDGANGTGDPATYPKCPFMFTGNPEAGQGWMDSNEADRRFMMTTGPFSMKKWEDTDLDGVPEFGEPGVQEIVAGVIVARGATNLNSVTELKAVDNLAQLAYELNFILAKAPSAPHVTTSGLPNEIILTWDDQSEFNADGSPYESADPIVAKAYGDTVIINNVEEVIDDSTYNFYGYTVYQYSDASGRAPVKVDHWDVTVDNAIDPHPYTKQRMIRIQANKHPDVGNVGDPLINGKEYYYGVTAEAYLEYGAPKVFTSAATIVRVIPQSKLGERYAINDSTGTYWAYGDTIKTVVHSVIDANISPSDGSTVVWIVDPSQTTGLEYTVSFNPDLTWNLVKSTGDTVIKNEDNQTGNDAYDVVDGLMVKVTGPDPGINLNIEGPYGVYPGAMGYGQTGGARWVSWPTNWGLETMFGALGNGFSFFGSDCEPTDYVDVEIQFAGIPSWPQPDSSSTALMAVSKAAYPERWQKGVVYRRDLGYAVQSQLADIPATVWDTEANPPRQLKVAIVEDARAGVGNGNFIWDMGWDGSAFSARGGREYFFIINDDYDDLYTDYLNGTLDGTYNMVMYAAGWGERPGHPYLEDDFEIQIYASNVNSPNDLFRFTAPAAKTATTADKKADLKKIKVVPNPYYGYHSGELNIFERWVQFTHLPEKCTIRIFDLAGNQIRKLEKNDPTTTFMQWDLSNEYQLPVASSIYIYHVEVPGVGNKVGKIAVFTPNERLDTY